MENKTGLSAKQLQGSGNNFKPPLWSHHTNIYEVNLRQYTQEGTINAFIHHLSRLKDMGVETLWFIPITPISFKNRKGTLGSYYACANYLSVSTEFGTIEDFKTLVSKAHSLGMKVIIDWVANHTGWDHIWTREHPDWYKTDDATGDFKMASGMEDIIELDFSNRDMRQAMINAMKFWITEFDIDGFRCDLAYWVQLDFWVEARRELEKIKHLFWLGELDPLARPEYMGAFDAAYTWTWMHKTKEFYHQELAVEELDKILDRYEALGNKTMRAWFTTNHDENSWNGTEYEKYGEMALELAVFSCTWNGIPLLYSGQELPNIKRLEFFEKDPIHWTDHPELHEFYKKLLTLKFTHPALRTGDENCRTIRFNCGSGKKVFSFLRKNGEREILVLLNFSGDRIQGLQLPEKILSGIYTPVFSATGVDLSPGDRIELSPWGFLVYSK